MQYDDLKRRINEEAVRDYNAELVKRNLQDFRKVFLALTRQEQAEALQCLIKDITIYPDKMELNIFEYAEFAPSSQKRKVWLGDQDSNLGMRIQSPQSYH